MGAFVLEGLWVGSGEVGWVIKGGKGMVYLVWARGWSACSGGGFGKFFRCADVTRDAKMGYHLHSSQYIRYLNSWF